MSSRITQLTVSTQHKRQVIDLTDRLKESARLVQDGICHLFVRHTTAALSVADLDPGTDLDMLDAFEELIPKLDYRHPHHPAHVPDHILSALIGTEASVPIRGGALALGSWQRVVLFEFDGPRERHLDVTILTVR